MKSGICPKCGSTKIYGNTGNPHGIVVDRWAFPQLSTILLVCTDCGFLEFYVEDEAKLAKLREKFGKVE
jgi:predicted nucleic-acid-binding Zn-ribbon protein